MGVLRSKKATSRYVLVTKYDINSEKYTLIDPEQGEMIVSPDVMQEAFNTLITKKKRDHRMLVIG